MTSSNVSNMLVQVSGINVEMPDSKQQISKNGLGFDKTLQNAIKPNDLPAPTATTNQKTVDTNDNSFSLSKETKMVKTHENPDDTNEEIVKQVNETVEKVKTVIEEELDVTEEEIENAMETLGLTAIDLLNPQDLAQLVATLTGEEDSIALVMSDEFKGILDAVNELTNQLFDETGISFVEIKDIVISFEGNDKDYVDLSEDKAMEILPENEPRVQISEEDTTNQVVTETQAQPEIKTEDKHPESEVKNQASDVESEIVVEKQDSTNYSNGSTKQDSNFSRDESTESFTFKQVNKNQEQVVRNDGMIFAEPRFELQFSSEEQIIALPTGETVTSEDIVNQLVEQAKILNEAESTTMEMTLNPEGLGRIFMEVTQKGDEITARIFTENDAVKQALETQMANLRVEMNQNSSAKVTSIEVSVGAHEFEKNLEEDARNEQRREDQTNQSERRSSRIDLNNLDDISGLMSEEDILIAQMMKDNGNTLDFQA